jgi:hypothetical protein
LARTSFALAPSPSAQGVQASVPFSFVTYVIFSTLFNVGLQLHLFLSVNSMYDTKAKKGIAQFLLFQTPICAMHSASLSMEFFVIENPRSYPSLPKRS